MNVVGNLEISEATRPSADSLAADSLAADSLAADSLAYMTGFDNSFATEAVPHALPLGRNSPQKAPLGLYAEQLSGSAFTAPRAHNKRIGLYGAARP